MGAAFLPAQAWAAEAVAADSARPEIVVNGERQGDVNPNANPDAPYKVERSSDSRFTENVRDTPKSVTIIPKEVIEDVGATTFRELARTTPGVTLGTGEGGNAFGDRIFIRGFEARNDIYIDGQRDPGVSSREVFAIEQVEIVKGPSSAYMGRGTTGGSVGLQSKRAQTGNDFVVAEGTVGTENFYRGTLDVNYELADSLALRVNGLYHSSDIPGRDYVDTERYGVAAALGWRASDSLQIGIDYYHFRSDGMSDYGHPFDSTTQEPYAVDPDNFYGAVGRDFLENDADILTGVVEWAPVDGLTLRSQTRYGEVDNRYVVSVPRSPDISDPDPANWTVATGSPQRNATTRYIGNITSANADIYTGGIAHALVLGGEYSSERLTNRRYTFPEFVEDENGNQQPVSGGFTRNLFDPDPVLGYTIPAIVDTSATPTVTDVESFSLFLIDTIKFSPQLELLLGGRYDTFAVSSTGSGRGGPFSESASYGFFNTQASLLYKPVEAVSLYASFSTSSNPSGEQLDSTSASYGGISGVSDLEPERNKAYELGAKWELADGDILLTAAAFRIDKTNARENAGGGNYVNVGRQRSDGFELGVNGNLTSRWALFGGYTYLDATIRNSQDPAINGTRFANVPKHSFSLLTSYAITDRLTLGGQAFYRSRIYGGTLEAGTASVPGYWKFDAVARFKLNDKVELRANVLNIFDERYYDAIYRSGSPFSYVAPGRSATLSVAVTL
jgi:catecholate siderophore receptor